MIVSMAAPRGGGLVDLISIGALSDYVKCFEDNDGGCFWWCRVSVWD